jgi:hypothetical protein
MTDTIPEHVERSHAENLMPFEGYYRIGAFKENGDYVVHRGYISDPLFFHHNGQWFMDGGVRSDKPEVMARRPRPMKFLSQLEYDTLCRKGFVALIKLRLGVKV